MDPINDGEEYSMYGMFAEVWFELQVSYKKVMNFSIVFCVVHVF